MRYFSDEAIKTFLDKGSINPEITIYSPIAGTVVQRKIGPGQYVSSGSSDPVFVVGDLSTVWLTAFVRESDAASVCIGQDITVNVMALPGRALCVEVRRDLLADPFEPFAQMTIGTAKVDRLVAPFVRALRRWW